MTLQQLNDVIAIAQTGSLNRTAVPDQRGQGAGKELGVML